jgi:RimJ/RimL family protein N-acetyltransferase
MATAGSSPNAKAEVVEFEPIQAALRDGRSATIRAIDPHDADELQDAFARLSREARYSRFMAPMKELSPAVLARAVHPAERDRVLVAVVSEAEGEIVVGGARYVRGADDEACEFAITIVDDWQGRGLASQMLSALIRDARARRLRRMEGYVLASNRAMLALARRLGFEERASEEGPSVRLVTLDLAGRDRV